MAIDKIYNDVQLYFNFNKEVTGATKLADSILYSNLDPTGATNMAIEIAKIYSWAKDVFTFNPSATGTTPKITINTSVLPEDSDTTYSFREGDVAGSFQVRENDEAWQTIHVHNVITELPEYSLANGTTADSIKLRKTLSGVTTDVSSVTLGLLDANGKILETFLPSYVDDVIEGYYYDGKFYTTSAHTTEIPAETGKIYVDIPSNTTYRWGGTTYVPITNPVDIMTGATSSTAGVAGLVPAPPAGSQNMFLRGDATWADVSTSDIKARQSIDTSNKNYPLLFSYAETSDTTDDIENTTRRNNSIYVNPSTGTITAINFAGTLNDMTINGTSGSTYNLNDITKVESSAINGSIKIGGTDTVVYTHPSYTAKTSGLYKVTVDSLGHVSAATTVVKSDITALGIPAQDTWIAMTGATSSANGTVGYVNAVPPSNGYNTKYLRADATWVDPVEDFRTKVNDETFTLVLHCTNGRTSS